MEKNRYIFLVSFLVFSLTFSGIAPYNVENNSENHIENNSLYYNETEMTEISDKTDVLVEREKNLKFNTTLWKYSADCSYSTFFGSCEPSKYIMSDNEAIRYVASNIIIDEKGRLIWDNCIFESCGIFSGYYVSDDQQFNYPPNGDYWINPDYYFYNGMRGDCEDSAFAVASILEAKGIKGIRTKIVGGFATINGVQIMDWIVEYKINGTYYRYYGGIPIGEGRMAVGFRNRDDMYGIDFYPSIMFGKNTYYEDYHKDW